MMSLARRLRNSQPVRGKCCEKHKEGGRVCVCVYAELGKASAESLHENAGCGERSAKRE